MEKSKMTAGAATRVWLGSQGLLLAVIAVTCVAF